MPETAQFTKYERARILGARALQIAMNAPLLVKIKEDDIHGRVKSYVSIDEKIKYREAVFDDIRDFIAFRVVVKDINDVWNVFALLQNKFTYDPSFLG